MSKNILSGVAPQEPIKGGLQVYEKEVGVNYVTDTELLYAIVCKTKNSFAKLTVTGLRSK